MLPLWLLLIVIVYLLTCNASIDCSSTNFHILHPDYDINSISVINKIEGNKSCVSFIRTKEGIMYVIKQMLDPKLSRQFSRVKEALGSYISESVPIPMNAVSIIPPDMYVPGKIFLDRPATIHTWVTGYQICTLPQFQHINIKQYTKERTDVADWGLSRSVIHSMSLYPDLPIIVAFDTFVGNRDRGPSNFFFDEKTNRFFGIDLDLSFKANLAELACQKIEEFLRSRPTFTLNEMRALEKYRDTLKILLAKNPPELLHKLLDMLSVQAGFNPHLDPNSKVARTILECKKWISDNYIHVQILVELLDKLMNR